MDRRQFLAVGAAGLAAAGVGIPAVATAEPKAPGAKLKTPLEDGCTYHRHHRCPIEHRTLPGARVCQAQLQSDYRRCAEGPA